MPKIEKIQTPEPLHSRFESLNIAVETYLHAPIFTVDEGQDIKKQLHGGQTKNLFLKDKKGKLWLVIALGETKVDLKWLPKRINSARLSFGNPELMKEVLGVTPGSVTPFSLINDTDNHVTVILDKAMLEYDFLNYHPLINDKTTIIKSDDLLTFIHSCGHRPIIVDFE